MWRQLADTGEVQSHMLPPHKHHDFHITRDAVLFTVGLLGVMHETLVSNGDRPGLLVVFAGMMGLPLYLGKGKGDE